MYRNLQNRSDLNLILESIPESSRVLDLGCGKGELIHELQQNKKCQIQGVEIHHNFIATCIEKGLPVIQSNLDEGLGDYPNQSFDYVILSRTLQVIHKPDYIIKEIIRAGKIGIISFPNFGYYQVRASLFFKGKMPITKALPYTWYNTPNIHLLTIKDFKKFCRANQITITKQVHLGKKQKTNLFSKWLPDLFASQSVFYISDLTSKETTESCHLNELKK